MNKFFAYAKISRIPSIGALGIAPAILFSIAEIPPVILLIGILIIWYILCTPLLGERGFKQSK